MKLFCFPLALSLLLAASVHAADNPPAVKLPAKPQFQLFILAGQSNMAGRGKVDDEARRVHPRVLSLNRGGNWQPAVDPLHWDKPAAGTGIGKPFAEIIAQQEPEISVGLVPTACGGSPISTWVPGGTWEQTKSHPYDDFLIRARRAQQDGTLRAILWHQGESDSNGADASKYEERLTALIARMRADLGVPELPFIIGQIGRFPAKPWDANRETVDAAQQAIAKKLKNVRYVAAEGLTSIGDNLHFDTPSLRTFARGYAEAYRSLVPAVAGAGK